MEIRFTENFIELCEQSNLNQKQIAKEIGINQSQISRYLKGILPDIKTVVKIADYFNHSIDYMIGLIDNEEKTSKKGYNPSMFYKNYQYLLNKNNTTHYQLAKNKIVCETSLRLWKKDTLPKFEVICNIAYYLGGSVDELLGR